MPGTRCISLSAAAVALAAVLAPSVAAAQVEVAVSAEGRRVITNENDAQRDRRLAARMVDPPRPELLPLIERHAYARGLDPRLVRAVVQAESGYNAAAVSVAGAQGLMQLMPETARELAVEAPFDPEENLRGGTEYLRRMLERFGGRTELALAAYNAGPGAVERHGGVPPYRETVEYVRRVLELWQTAPPTPSELPRTAATPAPFAGRPVPAVQGASFRAPGTAFAPARPVSWRRDGTRLHLTNTSKRERR